MAYTEWMVISGFAYLPDNQPEMYSLVVSDQWTGLLDSLLTTKMHLLNGPVVDLEGGGGGGQNPPLSSGNNYRFIG